MLYLINNLFVLVYVGTNFLILLGFDFACAFISVT